MRKKSFYEDGNVKLYELLQRQGFFLSDVKYYEIDHSVRQKLAKIVLLIKQEFDN